MSDVNQEKSSEFGDSPLRAAVVQEERLAAIREALERRIVGGLPCDPLDFPPGANTTDSVDRQVDSLMNGVPRRLIVAQ